MRRVVLISYFACLSLVASCADFGKPTTIVRCTKANCAEDAGSGGVGESGGGTTGTGHGGAVGTGGETAASGGVTAASGGETAASGGRAAGTGGRTAGTGTGTAGAGGRTTDTGAGTGGRNTGTGGGTAGTSGVGGSSGSRDAGRDALILGPETGSPTDTRPSAPDASVPTDTPRVGPEAGGPEPGPEAGRDAAPDAARDRAVDLTLDTATRSDAGIGTGSCIQTFQANGYSFTSASGVLACTDCKENATSQEAECKAMIDCLRPVWPCAQSASCWMNCRNQAGGDMVLDSCVANLTSKACAGH
jgi:hypothetical protein